MPFMVTISDVGKKYHRALAGYKGYLHETIPPGHLETQNENSKQALTSFTLSEMSSCLAQAKFSSSDTADFSGCKLSMPFSPGTGCSAFCHCATVCLQEDITWCHTHIL